MARLVALLDPAWCVGGGDRLRRGARRRRGGPHRRPSGAEGDGKRVQAGLQQFSSRGAGIQLGRTWTALIVVQVAFAVAALPGTIFKAAGLFRMGTLPPAAAEPGSSEARCRCRATADDLRRALRRTDDDADSEDARAAGGFRCHVRRRHSGSRRARVTRAGRPFALISSHVNSSRRTCSTCLTCVCSRAWVHDR